MESRVLVRRIVTASGTFLCALGIGHFMQATAHVDPAGRSTSSEINDQTTDSAGEGFGASESQLKPNPNQPKVSTSSLFSTPAPAVLTWTSAEARPSALEPSRLTIPTRTMPPTAAVSPVNEGPSEAPFSTPISTCNAQFIGQKSDTAMVHLTLKAPCLPDTGFTVHHSGMVFTDLTDDAGEWEMNVPALTEQALFFVSFGNGEVAMTSVETDRAPEQARIVLQWEGPGRLELKTLESGDGYIDLWYTGDQADRGSSDIVHELGGGVAPLASTGGHASQGSRTAHVRTVSTLESFAVEDLTVHAEAMVTESTCGQDIEAQILIQNAQASLFARDLVFPMPDCGAVGDVVLLKSLDHDVALSAVQ